MGRPGSLLEETGATGKKTENGKKRERGNNRGAKKKQVLRPQRRFRRRGIVGVKKGKSTGKPQGYIKGSLCREGSSFKLGSEEEGRRFW